MSNPVSVGDLARTTLLRQASGQLKSQLATLTKEAATVASIHIPHCPCWNSARFSLKPLASASGGPSAMSPG